MSDFYGYEEKYEKSVTTNTDNTKLPLSGGTMTGALTLREAPRSNLHASTKKYTDDQDATKLLLSGGTMTGDTTIDGNNLLNVENITFTDTRDRINMRNKQLKNISVPTDNTDAVSKGYVEGNFLQLSGGTMIGFITLNSHPTKGLPSMY